MSSPPHNPIGDCAPDTVIEQYAAGLLPEEDRLSLEQHLQTCSACAARMAEISEEWVTLCRALDQAAAPHEKCVEENTLAQYLDRALDAAEHETVEKHLATCRACQARLVNIYSELRQLLEPGAEAEIVEHPPAQEGPRVSVVAPPPGAPLLPRERPVGVLSGVLLGLAVLALGVAAWLQGPYVLPLLFVAMALATFVMSEASIAGLRRALDARATFIKPVTRLQTALSIATVALFLLSFLLPSMTTWWLLGAAAVYWAWLLVRMQTRLIFYLTQRDQGWLREAQKEELVAEPQERKQKGGEV
jgi:anti-sigma factor RsiW